MISPIVGVVDPIKATVELVDSLMSEEVVDSTTDVVDPTTVETKLVDSFVEEVVDTWAEMLVDAKV